ncbi:MAG: dipeptidase [Pseudomonadota bacterium]|nr:dipeptidase [Pseudomonadota bacterium]
MAKRVFGKSIVCDMTLPISVPTAPEFRDSLVRKLVDAGFTFVSFTVVEDETDTLSAFKAIGHYRRFFLGQPEHCILVNTVDDIYRAKREGKLAVSLHFQGTVAVGRDLSMVELFYKLGVRHMLLAYNQKNFVADGCHELADGGLSRFGRDLISEMNRVGMFVDVAHTGYRSSMDAVEFSDRPVICSHGNVWAIHKHARCYKDDQITAIARSGGVFGLTGLSIFTGDDEATVEKYVEQIDYVAQLAGPRHVGLGMDYVPDMVTLSKAAAKLASRWPADGGYSRSDIKQIELHALPQIAEQLLRRGYSEVEVGLVLGGNWMRLMAEVWKAPA